MSSVPDLLADILGNGRATGAIHPATIGKSPLSPGASRETEIAQNRPESPQSRPAESPATIGKSPKSPLSPTRASGNADGPRLDDRERSAGMRIYRALLATTSGRAGSRRSDDRHEAGVRSWRWLLHYPGREPVEVRCLPEPTQAEVLEAHPDAIAAGDHQRLTEWLDRIGEDDPAIREHLLAQCARDPEARAYFLAHAGTLARPDDRRHCRYCRNLSRGVFAAAVRIGATKGYQPVDTLPRRCAAFEVRL